jgi:hypothetical protein
MPTPMDYLSTTVCQITPGTITWGPGWYLVAANARVEAGPFLTEQAAAHAAEWLDDSSLGVHPSPWEPRYSAVGLIVGSRIRDRSGNRSEDLAHAV